MPVISTRVSSQVTPEVQLVHEAAQMCPRWVGVFIAEYAVPLADLVRSFRSLVASRDSAYSLNVSFGFGAPELRRVAPALVE